MATNLQYGIANVLFALLIPYPRLWPFAALSHFFPHIVLSFILWLYDTRYTYMKSLHLSSALNPQASKSASSSFSDTYKNSLGAPISMLISVLFTPQKLSKDEIQDGGEGGGGGGGGRGGLGIFPRFVSYFPTIATNLRYFFAFRMYANTVRKYDMSINFYFLIFFLIFERERWGGWSFIFLFFTSYHTF